MFCDLVGSTALSEKLDPEELRNLLHAYRRILCGDVIARYDGFVARYVGDGTLLSDTSAPIYSRYSLDCCQFCWCIRWCNFEGPPTRTGKVLAGDRWVAGQVRQRLCPVYPIGRNSGFRFAGIAEGHAQQRPVDNYQHQGFDTAPDAVRSSETGPGRCRCTGVTMEPAVSKKQVMGGKSPGTQVQHTLSIGTKGTEFRRFLASKCGTVRASASEAKYTQQLALDVGDVPGLLLSLRWAWEGLVR